jgi:hypothetical protein
VSIVVRDLSAANFPAWSLNMSRIARTPRSSLPTAISSRGSSQVDHRPFFVSAINDDCEIFLSAAPDIPDLGLTNRCDGSRQSGHIPTQIFFRASAIDHVPRAGSPDAHWHNDLPLASFILDDPLLRPRYGFVDYAELLRRMQLDRFCTSLAFIPWNHNRSNRAITELFATHTDCYSLCVHGCDHTWAEFGSSDAGYLRNQARQALERMERHHTRFGLKYDPVMVFPQGIFSTAAIDALKSCHYLAAVNSTPYPIDRDTLPLRSLFDIAVTDFLQFPLFIRRAPAQIAELAFDLFLGRPAIIVAHHDFFSAGYEGISNLVQRLSDVEPGLTWAESGNNLLTGTSPSHDGRG